MDFPGGAAAKNLPANAGDTGSSPGRANPTCHGATKPVCHNYWACALEPMRHNYWARVPRAHTPQQEKPPQWEARALQWRAGPACGNQRKPAHNNEDPTEPKTNKFIKKRHISKKKQQQQKLKKKALWKKYLVLIAFL